jgi:hypothetical protein
MINCRSQWSRGLRRRFAAACLLRSWVQILPGVWKFVCYECCVLSGRGLWDELITRPEESYRLWCVAVCDLETLRMRRPWPALGRRATKKKINYRRPWKEHKNYENLGYHKYVDNLPGFFGTDAVSTGSYRRFGKAFYVDIQSHSNPILRTASHFRKQQFASHNTHNFKKCLIF